jgi:hypothetical protein
MAVTTNTNLIISHFSGKLGEVVVKRYKDKIVLSAIPDMSSRKLSKKQKDYHRLMREANKYAQKVIMDAEHAEFARKALKVEPAELYRALVSEYIAAKGDRRKLIKMPGDPKVAQEMAEYLEMACS